MAESELANMDKPGAIQAEESEEEKPVVVLDSQGNKLPPWLAQPEFEKASFGFYLESEHSLIILTRRWVSMSLITFLIYIFHLVMAIWAVNVYTDVRQNRTCKEGQTSQDAASVYQTALGLSAIWHMIEWNRAALHFFSALVEVNMIKLYYAASFNVLFGFITCFFALGVRYGEEGKLCAPIQESRAAFLSLHILFLILYIFTSFHHVLIFRLMGEKWCHETINEPEEMDDDSEEEEDE